MANIPEDCAIMFGLSFGYAERMGNGQTVHRISDGGHWVAAEMPKLFAKYWLDFANNLSSKAL